MPPGRDFVALDSRMDVLQLAFVALSVLLGRRIDRASTGTASLERFNWTSQPGFPTLPDLRRWIERALNDR
jgi:hypothetical protein